MLNWLRSRSWLWCAVLVGFVIIGPGSIPAQNQATDDDEEAVRFPGIVGTYIAGGRSVSRRDADIEFVWDTKSPFQQLPTGPFQAQWQGKLLVRAPGKYRFYAQLQGQVEATLAKQPILAGQTVADAPAKWISGAEVEFEYGEHPLVVRFQSTSPAARLKLYWSSEAFALEPIPSGAYFLNEAHPEFELQTRGKELFAAHRCNRCHQRKEDPPSPPGPDLTHVSQNLTAEGLQNWLSSKRPASATHFNMPEFGFTDAESHAVAAFLRSVSQPVTFPEAKPELQPQNSKDKAPPGSGRTLLNSIGCLACHTYGDVGSQSRLGGGDLAHIGAKRSAEWLRLWLTNPAQLNADHRMPVFKFGNIGKQSELTELVNFLAASRPAEEAPKVETPAATTVTPEVIDQGKKLVADARCAACHRIPGIPAVAQFDLPSLEQLNSQSSNSCLQTEPNRESWRPGFPEKDLEALRAYVSSRTGTLTPEGSMERGPRVLAWNNCLQCHPREGTPGLGAYAVAITKMLPELEGAVPTLVPPSLNAVGDKLRDDVLLKSVAGEFPATRLPWLKVRMPKFSHAEEDRQALAGYLTQHDRIDAHPAEWGEVPPVPMASQRAQALAVGHSLLGSQGFSCIACHQFGKFQPRNAALGTRGSDLQNIGNRIRREYFLRWTRSPIRIVPDMEMPGFERPFPGLLGGQIQTQLAALWEALHDPNSTRPLEVASVQQNFVVRAGEPARIVRDVFAVPQPGKPDVYIPRAFATGFNNQHNILFDLDTFSVREWWFGNFSRQRTEGKSWYWDLGGTRIVTGLQDRSSIALVRRSTQEPPPSRLSLVAPTSKGQSSGRLVEYAAEGDGIRLVYQLKFEKVSDAPLDEVLVTERWHPQAASTSGAQPGWIRQIAVSNVPDTCRVVFVRPDFKSALDVATVTSVSEPAAVWNPAIYHIVPDVETLATALFLNPGKPGEVSGEFQYTTGFQTPRLESPELPVVNLAQESYATVPGYAATRLPLPRSIMPTAMTWTADNTLAFTSLKGHVYLARDTNADGLEDKLDLFEEGLAAPYGIITDPADGSLLVSHKPEVLRLIDTNQDGRADRRDVFATGWGYNDNYHDWTCGIVRDRQGNLYVGLGSDYSQPKRPVSEQRWRGKVLRINPQGEVTPIASGLRYPTGLALNAEGELFTSDNQGEQNVFNELNHIVEGNRYGVPGREDKPPVEATLPPAIQFPHPWTRSINGIFFIPSETKALGSETTSHPFAGHGIGCEYDSRYLIRFSLQKVGDMYQGAVYPFSQDHVPPEVPNFEGTLCGGISPKGDIYIGCIHDSGWLGGLNVGSIVRVRASGEIPLGIRELKVTPQGFQLDFTSPLDRAAAAVATNYTISAYTREWQGTYATPDSNRHVVTVNQITVSADGKQVVLHADKLRTGYVYEVSCGKIGPTPSVSLWPAIGHYTLNRLPVEN